MAGQGSNGSFRPFEAVLASFFGLFIMTVRYSAMFMGPHKKHKRERQLLVFGVIAACQQEVFDDASKRRRFLDESSMHLHLC